MTLNNNPIDVYFHMRNHYKKLKHVKSVIDCCPPKKGRAREKSAKASDTPSLSKQQNDRSKSASRPKTRRNTKETPRQKSKSAGRQEATTSSAKCDVNSYEQHEYLQFSLRITEDIIKNDLYDNEQMKRVLASHFEANKSRLDPDKMIAALYELCLELNIPIAETLEAESKIFPTVPTNSQTNSKKCICADRTAPETSNEPCLCMTERTPPIPCKVHPSICTLQAAKANSNEVKSVHSDGSSVGSEKIEYIMNKEEEESPEVTVLHAPTKRSTNQSVQSLMEGNVLCNCGSENCIPDACGGGYLIDNLKKSDHVMADVPNDQDSEVSVIIEETPYLEQEGSSETVPEYEPYGYTVEEEQEEEGEEKTEEEVKKEEVDTPKMIDNRALDCDLECLVMEYDKKMAHPRNMQMLNVSHYTSTIEPVCVNTCDLDVQTSLEKIAITCCVCGDEDGEAKAKKLSVSRGTQSCAETCESTYSTHRVVIVPPKQAPKVQQSGSDFIVFEGPVFIPKAVISKGMDIDYMKQKASSNHCDCGHPVHTHPSCSTVKTHSTTNNYPHKNQDHPYDFLMQHERPPYEKCEPCRTSSVYNKPQQHYSRHYHECDITPQREISMYNNINCKQHPNSSCCMRSDNHNLLLGNHYSRYSMGVTNNMSYFYPTIATQVSSMDILNTQRRSDVKSKVEETKPNYEIETEVKVLKGPRRNTLEENSSLASPTSDTATEALNKLKQMQNIAATDSTDSMDKRIQSLRMDMAKFREGENVQNQLPRPPPGAQDNTMQSRERGVSISEEVELIKDYDFGNTKNSILR